MRTESYMNSIKTQEFFLEDEKTRMFRYFVCFNETFIRLFRETIKSKNTKRKAPKDVSVHVIVFNNETRLFRTNTITETPETIKEITKHELSLKHLKETLGKSTKELNQTKTETIFNSIKDIMPEHFL